MQVPALAYNVAYAVNSLYIQRSPGYIVLSHTRNLLVNVNSAVNFILYCAVGQKFRRVFLQTFCQLTLCGDVTATQFGLMVDLPSTHAGAGDRVLHHRSSPRRLAEVNSLSMQEIDNADRLHSHTYHRCGEHRSSSDIWNSFTNVCCSALWRVWTTILLKLTNDIERLSRPF